ncbi:MAG: 16S rRNA (uracil(1498)-N(3))-methyltransferase [Actinobacteria bacterium]|nr:16S rRNA (uracil(1498)-N(3))-methyltransferase [Actinomycetota bacterium]
MSPGARGAGDRAPSPAMLTRGPHFFVDPVAGDSAVLRGDDAHHLAAVLRARAGDPVSLADGTGALMQARVVALGDEVRLAVGERHDVPPPRPSLTVVHALPRGRKLDEVVRRLSEVGVDRLVPARSQRTQARLDGHRAARATRRWRAVAEAAGKQSRRARPLRVADVTPWAQAFAGATGVTLWEEARRPLRDVLAGLADEDALTLAIGPEGGMTEEEVRAAGLPAASLGPTLLRTETAALVAVSATLYALGRLG